MLEKVANYLGHLKKWHHGFVVFLLGAITSLALPPLNFSLLIFLTFPMLIFILDGRFSQHKNRWGKFTTGFATGWWFGFGYFVTSLYWIGASFLVEADKFAVFIPLAVLALPAGLALFWGFAFGLSLSIWRLQPSRILILAGLLSGFEWLRGHVLTGFPWNTLGYVSDGLLFTNQLASLVGLYGLTLIILIWAMSPVLFIGHKVIRFVGGLTVASMFAGGAWGYWYQTAPVAQTKPAMSVRVVQANIPQVQKWAGKFRRQNIQTYFDLSASTNPKSGKSLNDIDVLVWPESALPVVYNKNDAIQRQLSALLPSKTLLIMGALRRDHNQTKQAGRRTAFNSVVAVKNQNSPIAIYDKAHLVPFGEYLPGERYLAPLGLRKIVDVPLGFQSGKGPSTIAIKGYPSFSAMVCYEIIFSGQVIDTENRPDWIVNVTNDAWFGATVGPYQHLAQAQFRAIETGLPVIRAANTGISAVIDGHGKIVSFLALETQGILDASLPPKLANTWFNLLGDYGFFGFLICMLIFIGLTQPKKSRKVS